MAPRRTHTHNYTPYKRINRILIKKCACGGTVTEMIVDFTKARAQEFDDLIEQLKER